MIRILLITDVILLRGALSAVLSAEEDLEVVGEHSNSDVVVQIARKAAPDVAVIDVDQDSTGPFAIARALKQAVPQCGVLLLTALGTPRALRQALDVHVQGYFSKESGHWQLAEAIRRVAKGERVIDPAFAVAALSVPRSPLTGREVEVLRLAGDGLPLTEIASELHLAQGTVRNYLSTILRKTSARNRLEAVRVAVEAGWL